MKKSIDLPQQKVESTQNEDYIFPTGLSARTGTVVTTLDPTLPVVYGQRMILNRQQPVTPSAPTTKRFTPPAPQYDPSKDTEQDRRLDNLESNTSKNNERDVTLHIHGQLLKILVEANNGGTPHPTPADYDSLSKKREE